MPTYDHFGRPDLIGTAYQDPDLIGGTDILGAIEQIISGARRDRRAGRLSERAERVHSERRRDRLERRVNRLVGAPSDNIQVARSTPEVLRDYYLPLGQVTMEPGDPGLLRETAQRVIRLERLILDSPSLATVAVTSIALGVEQQNVAMGSAPASAWGPTAVGSTLRGNTLQIGQIATISLLNNGLEDATVSGMFRGEAIQY